MLLKETTNFENITPGRIQVLLDDIVDSVSFYISFRLITQEITDSWLKTVSLLSFQRQRLKSTTFLSTKLIENGKRRRFTFKSDGTAISQPLELVIGDHEEDFTRIRSKRSHHVAQGRQHEGAALLDQQRVLEGGLLQVRCECRAIMPQPGQLTELVCGPHCKVEQEIWWIMHAS